MDCIYSKRHISPINHLIITLIFILFFAFDHKCLAQPTLNSISGAVRHKSMITITGSGFGSKSPVEPLMWDDCEDRIVNDQSSVVDKGWVDPWPRMGTSSVEHRIMYRAVPYRNTPPPHSRSTKYLAGGHYQTINNNPPYIGFGAEDYRNVMVTADAGSAKPRWFALWYYRLDPSWRSDCPPNNNHKTSIVNAGGHGYSSEGFSYNVYRSNSPECAKRPQHNYHGSYSKTCIGKYPRGYPATNNPRTQWIHYEEQIANDDVLGFRNLYIDNQPGMLFVRNCPHWFAGGIRSYTIGGYYRWSKDMMDTTTFRGDVNNFRYFDDIYIDTTLSRVILANHSNYTKATIVEPQIPSIWTNNSIGVIVNLGRLPDTGTAYLFVFDANNNRNRKGYPVILAGEKGLTKDGD